MSFTSFRISLQMLLIALLVEPVAGQAPGRSVEGELRFGQRVAESFERNVVMSADPTLLTLVDRVAQQLSRNSRSPIPIVARVIQSDEINVIILPGGHIYVTSGLVRTAGTEAELAWAIAHGVARVSEPTSLLTGTRTLLWDRNETFSNPSNLSGLFGSMGGALGASIAMAQFNGARRTLEEADMLGLEYLSKSGYDPAASVSLFQKVEAISEASPKTKDDQGLFLIHPPLSQRIKRMESAIRKLRPRDRYIVTTQEFDDVRSRLSF
jgi:predicted Zn-dependent protease